MRKKWIGLVAALTLLMAASITARAEEFSGGDNWQVVFNGSQMTSTFSSADIDDAIYQLEPGDSVNIRLTLRNSYSGQTDWYMTNQVLRTLEDSQTAAEGGAYAYRLTYIQPDGTVVLLYDSENVGGERTAANREGLYQATSSLEDYFFLDRLAAGATGEIRLVVRLEGETQGNAYQNTLARLQMNFAVELVDTPPGSTTRTIRTGDDTGVLLFAACAFAAGLICLIAAVVLIRRRRRSM